MHSPQDTAAFLLEHRRTLAPVDNLPEALYPDSLSAAFTTQAGVVSGLCRRFGGEPCGYKIACTNARVIDLLNTSGPFPGRLMTHSTFASGAVLDPGDFRLRIMEAEFGFVIGKDAPISDTPYTADSIRPFIEAFIPSLEVVDHKYHDFTVVGENALIADNAIHGACVFGDPVTDWQEVDFARWPVRLMVNGEEFTLGTGENVLGDPLYAMAWLANHLGSRGIMLRAGEKVSTGTAGAIYHADPGDTICADFGELGRVDLRFSS